MNYESMSDFEINKAVANKLGLFVAAVAQDGIIVNGKSLSVDYCNNPSDAWPIITDNKISIMNDESTWEASIDFDGDLTLHGTDEILTKYYDHENPLRATMIVFLMMSESK
ncbi:hypothetical protein [Pseudoalteromonas phage H103]|uniref:hypothetical protein n=1 Tax=Pseudoalteromonas phage H103 TaxID=1636200 RepID=UPI0006BCD461|nr:hypothetical protein AVU31_gp29 [Pseudoalteromonas phage H103]AKA61205.1 hypothetical protein [Pseudoalteromonas phage H103]